MESYSCDERTASSQTEERLFSSSRIPNVCVARHEIEYYTVSPEYVLGESCSVITTDEFAELQSGPLPWPGVE